MIKLFRSFSTRMTESAQSYILYFRSLCFGLRNMETTQAKLHAGGVAFNFLGVYLNLICASQDLKSFQHFLIK